MVGPEAELSRRAPIAYDRDLCPAIFEPFARHVARHLVFPPGVRVLEIAAGTGVVTEALLAHLPSDGALTSTDINQDMIEVARARIGIDHRLAWQPADAQALPFHSQAFDIAVCQFGVMFFPDKQLAMEEARRVLRPGGTLALTTWDSQEHNPFGHVTNQALAELFPADPPRFFHQPFSYADPGAMTALLTNAGFSRVRIDIVDEVAACESASRLAAGLVLGTPIGIEVATRASLSHEAVIEHLTERLAEAGGRSPHRSPMRALVAYAEV